MTCASPVTLKNFLSGSKLLFVHPCLGSLQDTNLGSSKFPIIFWLRTINLLTCLLDALMVAGLANVGTSSPVTGGICLVVGL